MASNMLLLLLLRRRRVDFWYSQQFNLGNDASGVTLVGVEANGDICGAVQHLFTVGRRPMSIDFRKSSIF